LIYILNCYPVLESGHFWRQDFYFRKFFRAIGLKYAYINPSSALARTDDGIRENSEFLYLQIDEVEQYVSRAISLITKDIQHREFTSVCLFFPWLPQFTIDQMNEFSTLSSLTKLSIAGVSVRTSSAIWEGSNEIETFVHQDLFSSNPFELLWIGESVPPYLADSKNIRYLPEYAETKIDSDKSKDFDIGFFGMLSPYRGLLEVFIIALFNPKIKIKVRGYSFAKHRIWRPIKYRFLRYSGWRDNLLFSLIFSFVSILIGMLRFLPNIEFSKKPFPSEAELDDAISSCKSLLYCPKLRHGSGLMTKSLSAGIPVLWNGLPGQAYDFLNSNYPEGKFDYWEIFIPGRISRKLRSLPSLEAYESLMWDKVFAELSILRKFL
jgi:hypothetical protein